MNFSVNLTNRDELIPDRRYRVKFDDCCAKGFFISIFRGYSDDGDTAHFDDAVIELVSWGNYEFRQVVS